MTRDAVTARNRANAAASTGPKTAGGKAASSKNARQHGATGRPDQDAVATWLSVILDRPQISLGDLASGDDATRSAIALAEAEARLVAAEEAIAAFEEEDGGTEGQLLRSGNEASDIIDALLLTEVSLSDRRRCIALLAGLTDHTDRQQT